VSHFGLDERDIMESCIRDASLGPADGTWITFNTYYFSGRPNKSGKRQSHIPDAGAHIQNSLTNANSRFTEAPFAIRREPCSLPDQPFALRVRAAKCVMRRCAAQRNLDRIRAEYTPAAGM
jgi:hypothetical protein